MSRTIASLMIALVGMAGYTLSDNTALEVAGLVLQVGGLLSAWLVRMSRGDINAVGVKK